MTERMILMGVIGKPHGVRGLLRVNAFTAAPDALADYQLTDKTGRGFAIDWVMDGVAQLTEITAAGPRKITGRNEAERLTNTELFTPRSALGAPEEEEFYLTDLVGLQARAGDGQVLGCITAVHDYGGGASLEISPGALLIPFTQAAVPVVDVAAGFLVVRPPQEVSAA